MVLGSTPTRTALAILWAQAMLECERGKSCWCHNVGNIRGVSPGGRFTTLRKAHEFAKPENVPKGATIIPIPKGAAPGPPGTVCYLPAASSQQFRAYGSFVEGASDKLRILARSYRRAMAALEQAEEKSAQASARAFVAGLVPGYFSALPSAYAQGVADLTIECLTKVPVREWPIVVDSHDAPTKPETPSAIREPQPTHPSGAANPIGRADRAEQEHDEDEDKIA